jgi:hypothetical protein
MDNIATQMKDAADVITPTVDAMVANTNPRSSRVGTIIDSGSTLLMTGKEEFFTDKWIHDMSSGKRVWSVPREGRCVPQHMLTML